MRTNFGPWAEDVLRPAEEVLWPVLVYVSVTEVLCPVFAHNVRNEVVCVRGRSIIREHNFIGYTGKSFVSVCLHSRRIMRL